ncbi:hypothetical protein DFH09DRAFT_1085560 [Mycena vulgaris]|nr:hypothetical protein DFH09DRAFT_1085560 [Mycena vulgaris]
MARKWLVQFLTLKTLLGDVWGASKPKISRIRRMHVYSGRNLHFAPQNIRVYPTCGGDGQQVASPVFNFNIPVYPTCCGYGQQVTSPVFDFNIPVYPTCGGDGQQVTSPVFDFNIPVYPTCGGDGRQVTSPVSDFNIRVYPTCGGDGRQVTNPVFNVEDLVEGRMGSLETQNLPNPADALYPTCGGDGQQVTSPVFNFNIRVYPTCGGDGQQVTSPVFNFVDLVKRAVAICISHHTIFDLTPPAVGVSKNHTNTVIFDFYLACLGYHHGVHDPVEG